MITAIGWLSSILFIAMQIPQLAKTIQSKQTAGISILMWWVYLFALILSVTYLALQPEILWPVITNQSISAVLTLTQIVLILYFRKKGF